MTDADVRAPFEAATAGLCALAGAIAPDDWGRPALGSWDVRALVGHASRALGTLEQYIGHPVEGPLLVNPVDYLLRALSGADARARRQLDAAIAVRGEEAGALLGEDPCAGLCELAERVLAHVGSLPDTEPVGTPFGNLTLGAYLPTRTFELTVHSLDCARALDLPVPAGLRPAIDASLALASRLAAASPHAADLLLLLAGRRGLPGGLSVL